MQYYIVAIFNPSTAFSKTQFRPNWYRPMQPMSINKSSWFNSMISTKILRDEGNVDTFITGTYDVWSKLCLIIMYKGRAVQRPCSTWFSSHISRRSADYWSQGKEMYKLSIAVLLGCFVGKISHNIHLTIFATLFISLLFW